MTETWDRRDVIGAGVLLAGVVGVPLAVLRTLPRGDDEEPSDRQRAMARQVAQILIPRTDTPGGADVGADEYLILALAHGLDGTRAPGAGVAIQGAYDAYRRQDGSLDHLAWLERGLDSNANGDFVGAPLARRQAALERLDAAAFAPGRDDDPWRKIKNLLLTGYYTSEAGASRELAYELVPGRWDPDLPLAQQPRAYSSDWTAVDFG